MFLKESEIRELTGKERPSAQIRELEHLGIPYRQRRDGSLVVVRLHAEGVPDGSIRREPRLRLVNGPTS